MLAMRAAVAIVSVLLCIPWAQAELVLLDRPPVPSGGSGVEPGPEPCPRWVEVEPPPAGESPLPLFQSDPVQGPFAPQGAVPFAMTPSPSVGFNGIINSPVTIKPPDTHIAVGPGSGTNGRVIMITNAAVAIWDKTGGNVAGPTTLNNFWGVTTPRAFDPKVLYDQHSGRFFIVSLQGSTTAQNLIHIAVSSSGTPGNLSSNWTKLSGSAVTTIGGVGTWADYPGIGADNDSLFITTNQFDDNRNFVGVKIRVFDKSALLAGTYTYQDINYDSAVTPGTWTVQPAHVYGSTDTGGFYLICRYNYAYYRLFHVTGDPATPVATTAIYAWTGGAEHSDWGADQCTVGNPDIDTLDTRMMQAVYRGGHLWCTYTADPDSDGQTEVVWHDIMTIYNSPWVYQGGYINGSAGGVWTYQPSINVNAGGEAAVCYTESSSTACPAMYYTMRSPGDALGTFQAPVLAKNSAGYYDAYSTQDPERWGDYSATVVDPDDSCFWVAHEFGYSSGVDTSEWGTYIVKFCSQTTNPGDQACCVGTGCYDFQPGDCLYWGGTPQGAMTGCASNSCVPYEACCLPSGNCNMLPANPCQVMGGTPQGPMSSCGTADCRVEVPKFSQPPTPGGEDVASDLDWSDNIPNVVVADDFQSDGRPITGVRWWGSYLDPRYAPAQYGGAGAPPYQIDGFLISFHEPLSAHPASPPAAPLGLYFCDASNVTIALDPQYPPCDPHQVFRYQVKLSACCLVSAMPDSRSGWMPAEATAFDEQHCFRYDMDIQAVVGWKYTRPLVGGPCTPVTTPNFATADFWGWHSTGIENGVRQALQSTTTVLLPNQWLYGPWSPITPTCAPPPINMAFELLTTDATQPPPCPPEPCCLPDGTCGMLPAAACLGSGGTPKGAGYTCATVACPQPVQILGWRSVKTHSGFGPLPIALNPAAITTGIKSESRNSAAQNGLILIQVDFSGPVTVVNPAAVTVQGAVTTGCSTSGTGCVMGPLTGYMPLAAVMSAPQTMDIPFASGSAPGDACFIVTIGPGAVSAVVTGDLDCKVRMLQSDATADGLVALADVSKIKSQFGAPLSTGSCASDQNLAAGIGLADLSQTKSRYGRRALCP